MNEREILINNIKKIHTTKMGVDRIKKNIKIDVDDVIAYCVNKVKDKESTIIRNGKNYYVENQNLIITINAYSYTIITAHLKINK